MLNLIRMGVGRREVIDKEALNRVVFLVIKNRVFARFCVFSIFLFLIFIENDYVLLLVCC